MKFLALAAAASALRLAECDCKAKTLSKECQTSCAGGLNATDCCDGATKKTTGNCASWTGSCSFAADKATCCNGAAAKAGAPAECANFAC